MSGDPPPRSLRARLFNSEHISFLGLFLTTPIAGVLLHVSLNRVLFSGRLFVFVTTNRATVSFAVQILANILAICQVVVLSRLINYAVRIYLSRRSMKLYLLRAWVDAMMPRMNWDLPIMYIIPLLCYISLSVVLSAVWAAALTPVETWKEVDAAVLVPGWSDVSLIREYPNEVGLEGPSVHTSKGMFSYSIGMRFLGSLLSAAATATTVDGTARVHAKMDKSRFNYIGRSYGMGTATGLTDASIVENTLTTGYTFQEVGYIAGVKCIYNKTRDFRLETSIDTLVYPARGRLPDSEGGEEYSDYIGHTMDTIVAIGVAVLSPSPDEAEVSLRRYLAIAAGDSYGFLDKIQCEVDFKPETFDVRVSLVGRNITVVPTGNTAAKDIDPSRWLKGSLLRQYELIANDETNLYVSTVGTALNTSITDYRVFVDSGDNPDGLTEDEIVLKGVENSVTAMADDMLSAFAAAQLMVGNITETVPAARTVLAFKMGEPKFSIAVFAANMAIVALVAIEAARTRIWRSMPMFDASDIRHLVISASRGGMGIEKLAIEEGGLKRIGDLAVALAKQEAKAHGVYGNMDVLTGEREPMVKNAWKPREGHSERFIAFSPGSS